LSVLSFIAFLAVIIACLGLLGMAMSNTERRRKEIGIRKVLGTAEASYQRSLAGCAQILAE